MTEKIKTPYSPVEYHQLGYFGNIWVRQNVLPKIGDQNIGHKHYFDHVSLLAKGKVRVEVEGHEPKEFTAPTFIVIRKEHNHKFTALEPNTLWYCVFALRDVNGEVVDDIYGEQHDPMAYDKAPQDYYDKANKLFEATHEEQS
jgi:hypothetical protein